MSSLIDEDQYEPPLTYRGLVKAKIVDLVSSSDCITLETWTAINHLLNQLPVSTSEEWCSLEHDPMGRLLLGAILSKNPPQATVEFALRAFPCSLNQNPAAFFTACRDASTEIVSLMMRHVISCCDDNDVECPYPWLISGHISTAGAQAILDAYPEGVLKKSEMLSGYCLLDYFLLSPDMVEQQSFDMTLWSKFKLVLLATGYCCDRLQNGTSGCSCLSPVHTILDRVFSTPGELVDFVASLRHPLCVLVGVSPLCSSARFETNGQRSYNLCSHRTRIFCHRQNNHFVTKISSQTWSKLNMSFG